MWVNGWGMGLCGVDTWGLKRIDRKMMVMMVMVMMFVTINVIVVSSIGGLGSRLEEM